MITFANADPDERQGMADIAAHLAECAECRQAVEHLETWFGATVEELAGDLSLHARETADHLYQVAERASKIIPLTPWAIEHVPEQTGLAADGGQGKGPEVGLEHLATLYAEDADLILRVMRDRGTGEESLHLIGTDSDKTSNVLIQIAEPQMDFMTDASGLAYLGEQHISEPTDLKWSIRLPDAIFNLSPLTYDAEKPGTSESFTLETDRDNSVRVELESRAEGVMLRLSLMRIGGREELSHARVVVSQPSTGIQATTGSGKEITIIGLRPGEAVNLRIFAE